MQGKGRKPFKSRAQKKVNQARYSLNDWTAVARNLPLPDPASMMIVFIQESCKNSERKKGIALITRRVTRYRRGGSQRGIMLFPADSRFVPLAEARRNLIQRILTMFGVSRGDGMSLTSPSRSSFRAAT